jgi:hypothetical protein
MFDYIIQAHAVAHPERNYGGYTFLGSLYNNLFPINDKLFFG